MADARRGLYHVFIRDLVLPVSIGIYDFEKEVRQPVRLNIDMSVDQAETPVDDEHRNVVCYEKITNGVREIVASGHINLVETLAEEIAAMCLNNPRVHLVKVRVEKLDIIKDAASVGVEIERMRHSV